MFGIGLPELIVILALALIVFGPEKLPEIAAQLGRTMRDFRRMTEDVTGEFSRALVGDFGAGQALSDEQYQLITPLIPAAKPGGRPRSTDMRRLLDGLFYLVRCQWRHLPSPPAFPPWPTVYGYLRAFERTGVWEAIRHQFLIMLREQEGREPSPTAAILDTQSVTTTENGALAATTRLRR